MIANNACENTDLIDRQIALEEESLALGQERYWKTVEKAVKAGAEHTTKPAMALIRRLTLQLGEAIQVSLDEDAAKPAAKRNRIAVPLVKQLEAPGLAHITLRAVLAGLSGETVYFNLCERIGSMIVEELNFRRFREEDQKAYRVTQKHIDNANTAHKKRAVMRRMFRLSGITPVNWTYDQQVHAGAYLLDVLLQVAGDLFEAPVVVQRGPARRQTRVLRPTDKLLQWIKDGHDRLTMLCPVRMPMLVKPRDWTSPFDGGYLTDCGGQVTLLKTRNRQYLHALQQVDLSDVLDAVNAMQSVAWQINQPVLEVAMQCWENGIEVGDLPARDPEPLPAEPAGWAGRMHECRKEDYETYRVWARKAAIVHEKNARLTSKRGLASAQIRIASRFVEEDAIYFPHQLDFRGRGYAIPAHLNPQGSDLSKGLLRFAKGKPIGERGYWWLKVHVANCFGVDKVEFEERVAWAEEHMDELLASGLDPINSRFWMKADDPWQALAACFELVGYGVNGPNHVSHLPIPMDGSCNGLQNFSALLRDPVGGKATNLIPSDKPQDIYQEVAAVVSSTIVEDAEKGNPYAMTLDGKISRDIVKQPVMTQPYGATKAGMRSQIEDAIKKHLPTLLPKNETWKACGYLADITYDSIGQVVVAARSAMDWLREVAKVTAGEEYPIRWTSPMGLPVLQDYRETTVKQLRLHIDGKSQKLNLNVLGDKLDKRRQAAGISPNLIHSFDAAHMQRTILIGKANGIDSWAMVHDSFGTHAADVDVMHQCIREAFIEQYSEDLLTKFRDELAEQLPPELASQLPPVPPMGDLDLSVIRESRYFFA